MKTAMDEFVAMIEDAGIEHEVKQFVDRNEVHLRDARVAFVFTNSGALYDVERA